MGVTAAEILVRIDADAGGLNRGLAQSSGRMEGWAAGIGRVARRAFVGLAAGAILAGGAAVKLAGDYQSSLNVFQAVSKANAAQMKAVGREAIALGADLTLPATSAKDAADAMTELAKGGLSVTQTMQAAKGVLQLSAAAQISNADAATITARALKAFKLSGDDAIRVADVLANAANKSTGDITDFALGLQQSAAVAHAMGLSINETTAGIMAMADAGIVGSDAGTSLKTMLLRLTPQTKKQTAEFKALGINTYDANGKFVGMRATIEQFTQKLHGLTQEQRNHALYTIFGSDAIRAANIILRDGVGAYDSYVNATKQSGAAADLAAAKMKGFKGALQGLRSQLETIAIQAGSKLLPGLTAGLGVINKLLGAKSWDLRFHIVLDGLEAAGRRIDEFLFGRTIHIRGIDFGGMETVQTQGIVDKIAAGLGRVNWRNVGIAIGKGMNSAGDSAQGQADATGRKLGDRFVQALSVGLNHPERTAVAAAKLWAGLEVIQAKFMLLPSRLAYGFVASLAGGIARGASSVAASAMGLGTSAVRGVMSGLSGLFAAVMSKLAEIGGAIAAVAGMAYGWAMSIGSQIVSGVLSGLGGLAGRVAGAVGGAISKGMHTAGGWMHGSGEWMFTKHAVGKPLADGIVEGFLLGWTNANLPSKISEKLRSTMERARNVIQNAQSAFATAFTRLGDYALRAFDAKTDQMLARTQSKYDRARSIIDALLAVQQAGISSKAAEETPAERQLREMQDAQAEAQRQRAISSAQQGLESAQATGDPAQILAAQQALDDALYAEQEAQVARQAAAERKAKDEQAALDATYADAAAQRKKDQLDKKQAEDEKQTKASRDLQRQHLEDMLDDLEKMLEKHPEKWKRLQKTIGSLFAEFGITYKGAGKALGDAFAEGMRESFDKVEKTAKAIAELVAKYLPHSPAERGPLSKPIGWESYLMLGLAEGGQAATRTLGDVLSRGSKVPSPGLVAGGDGGSIADIAFGGGSGRRGGAHGGHYGHHSGHITIEVPVNIDGAVVARSVVHHTAGPGNHRKRTDAYSLRS